MLLRLYPVYILQCKSKLWGFNSSSRTGLILERVFKVNGSIVFFNHALLSCITFDIQWPSFYLNHIYSDLFLFLNKIFSDIVSYTNKKQVKTVRLDCKPNSKTLMERVTTSCQQTGRLADRQTSSIHNPEHLCNLANEIFSYLNQIFSGLVFKVILDLGNQIYFIPSNLINIFFYLFFFSHTSDNRFLRISLLILQGKI